mgnify:CR=1 FL=1
MSIALILESFPAKIWEKLTLLLVVLHVKLSVLLVDELMAFSTTDARGVLFREYVRLLEELSPKGFLFENVYGIIGAQGGEAWKEILEAFSAVGYKLYYRIVDAADYGQNKCDAVDYHLQTLLSHSVFPIGKELFAKIFPFDKSSAFSLFTRPHRRCII